MLPRVVVDTRNNIRWVSRPLMTDSPVAGAAVGLESCK
jgi:hypothetical protein